MRSSVITMAHTATHGCTGRLLLVEGPVEPPGSRKLKHTFDAKTCMQIVVRAAGASWGFANAHSHAFHSQRLLRPGECRIRSGRGVRPCTLPALAAHRHEAFGGPQAEGWPALPLHAHLQVMNPSFKCVLV